MKMKIVLRAVLVVFLALQLSVPLGVQPMTFVGAVDPPTYAIIQLTDNSYDDWFPKIHGGQVTWSGSDGHDWEIVLYDSATGTTTQLTDNSYKDWDPEIHGGQVTWEGWVSWYAEIFLYDSATGTTIQLPGYMDSKWDPKIHGGQVTWWGYGSDGEIFLYDSATGITTQFTVNNYYDAYPKIHGGQVTWVGAERPRLEDSEIYLYDSATGTTTQLTDNSYDDYSPKIHGGQVTWTGWIIADNAEIFLYDSATGTTTQLTDNSYEDVAPEIHGGQVTWMRRDDWEDDYEIFLATPIVEEIPPTAPETTISLSGTPGLNGWYVSDVVVTLTAVDDLSGVAATAYSFDGTAWTTYTGPFTITTEGSTTVYYNSTDSAGNVETTKTEIIQIDKTPPETTIGLSGTSGFNGWYVSDVVVTLTATNGFSGVTETVYSFDGTAWTTYTGPFTITTEGSTTVYYNSTDSAGNVEATKTATILIDKTPPTTDLTLGPYFVDEAGTLYVTAATEFILTATDVVSRVAHTSYRINGSDWIEYGSNFMLVGLDGTYVIDYYSVDVAGNEEIPQSVTVSLVGLKVNSYIGIFDDKENEDFDEEDEDEDSDFTPITYFDVVFRKEYRRYKKSGGYVLMATNPGQFYYSIEVMNDWPIAIDTLTLEASIPEDFVLKGTRSIHVYLDSTVITKHCAIDDTTIIVSNVPAGSRVYVTIHMDYALKKTRYESLDAFGMKGYIFAVSVSGSSGSPSVPGGGLFGTYSASETLIAHQKRTTAIAGFVTAADKTPVVDTTVELFDSNGDLIGTTVTIEDGFYYFLGIEAGDYTVQVTFNGQTYTQVTTVGKRKLAQVDFTSD